MFDNELRRQKTLLAVADTVAVAASVVTSTFINERRHALPCLLCERNLTLVAALSTLICIVWIFSARGFGLYTPGNRRGEQFLAIIKSSATTAVIVLTVDFLAHRQLPRLSTGMAFVLSLVLVPAARAVAQLIIAGVYANPKVNVPLVIVGCNPVSRYVCDQVLDVFSQYEVIGFLREGANAGAGHRGYPILGGIEVIPELVARHRNLEVAIILPDFPRDVIEEIIKTCEQRHVPWRVMPAPVGGHTSSIKVDMVGVVPLISPRSSNLEGLNFILKRMFDLIVGYFALVVGAPVMLLAVCAVWLFDGPPVLFRQSRIGIHGEPFELLKFRTMRAAAPDDMHRDYVRSWIKPNGSAGDPPKSDKVFKLASDPRVTQVGKWLRRFSIDELPQLLNVLRGDMSLIGPRPALPYELDFYQDWHRRRLGALPGMTGLWQVSGRNHLSFDQMVKLDIKYIEEWSFGEDLRILIRTVPALLGGGH